MDEAMDEAMVEARFKRHMNRKAAPAAHSTSGARSGGLALLTEAGAGGELAKKGTRRWLRPGSSGT